MNQKTARCAYRYKLRIEWEILYQQVFTIYA